MKIFFNIKRHRLFAAFLALIILMSLSGCDVLDKIIGLQTDATLQTQTDSVIPSTAAKATAPVNDTGKNLYGFDNIDDESVRTLYWLIDECADKATEDEVTFEGMLSSREVFEAVYAYIEDHPEKFWLNGNRIEIFYEIGITKVAFNYRMDYETRVKAQNELEEKMDEIISNAPSNATQFELEQYVHNYIVDNCEYDHESAASDNPGDNTGNVYGVLIEGKAVCEGYSRAFQLLCRELGLECVNIFGTSEDEGHMWNCIKIEGEWYHVDVTWDDPETDQEDAVRYLFFNLNDENICKDHQISELYENLSYDEYLNLESNANLFVPQCTATEYNYHLYYGALVTDIDNSDDIVETIAQAAKDNRDYFYLTADSGLDYEDVSSKLIEGGYIAEWIDSANFKNFYSPNLNVQTDVYTISEYNLFIIKLQYI